MSSTRVPRGEQVVTWGIWSLLLVALVVTYSRLDPAELYHVSRDGVVGGLSRALVAVNFPVALVAIALTLVAMASLPTRAWWAAGPVLALCVVTTVPGVVDDGDLDARWINVAPALGVMGALVLAAVAVGRSAPGFSDRLPLDPARWVLVALALVVAIPWIFADLGVFLPDGVFIMERSIVGSDGRANPAVHLGHHHGLDGSLFVVSAALLSRVQIPGRRLAAVTAAYLSLLAAYGGVNFVQDAWNEQLWKRDLVGASIPSAYDPALDPIWLLLLVLAGLMFVALRWERRTVVRRRGDETSQLDGAGGAGGDLPLADRLDR